MLKLRAIPFLMFCFLGTAGAWQMTPEAFEETKIQCEIHNDGAECTKLYYYYISSKRNFLRTLREDKKKALYYAQKACDLEDEDGCFAAGMILYYGDDDAVIAPNKDEGRKLLKKACNLGKEDVCTYFLNPRF